MVPLERLPTAVEFERDTGETSLQGGAASHSRRLFIQPHPIRSWTTAILVPRTPRHGIAPRCGQRQRRQTSLAAGELEPARRKEEQ